jgi:hypothetical protein
MAALACVCPGRNETSEKREKCATSQKPLIMSPFPFRDVKCAFADVGRGTGGRENFAEPELLG